VRCRLLLLWLHMQMLHDNMSTADVAYAGERSGVQYTCNVLMCTQRCKWPQHESSWAHPQSHTTLLHQHWRSLT
jgi:hypothetical protein